MDMRLSQTPKSISQIRVFGANSGVFFSVPSILYKLKSPFNTTRFEKKTLKFHVYWTEDTAKV